MKFLEMFTQIRILWVLILVLLFMQFSSAQTIDRIIAIVNDEVIAQSDVDRALSAIETEYRSLYSDSQEFERKLKEIKKNIINQMIEEKLVLCEAKRFDIKIDEDKIEARIEQIKRNFINEVEFEKALLAQGLTLKDLRDRFRNQEIMRKAVDYFVKFDIKIEPIEIREFYQAHQRELVKPEKAKVASILIKVDGPCDEYEALQKSRIVLERLRKGDNFEELAKSYSQGVSAEKGGDFGIIERGQLLEEIDEAIFSLKPGEFTDVIKTHSGYRIFKVIEKKPEEPLTFSEAQDVIRKTLYNKEFREIFKEWIEELKQNAYISIKE